VTLVSDAIGKGRRVGLFHNLSLCESNFAGLGESVKL